MKPGNHTDDVLVPIPARQMFLRDKWMLRDHTQTSSYRRSFFVCLFPLKGFVDATLLISAPCSDFRGAQSEPPRIAYWVSTERYLPQERTNNS